MSEHTEFVFAPPPIVSLPVAGSSARFPVRRIYCVGRNYLDHIRELNNDEKAPPVFFSKPRDAIVQNGSTIPYASATQNLHYEVELAVALHSGGRNISANTALEHVFGYAVALDMTRRDLQKTLSSQGSPWDVAKGFDQAAPCGTLHPASVIGHLHSGPIQLHLNGELKQNGDLQTMIWNVPHIIEHLSRLFELHAGDIILTGTPAGVGPVQTGDTLRAEIASLSPLSITIGAACA